MYEDNLRELCRKNVAGIYLKHLDASKFAKQTYDFLISENMRLKTQLDKASLLLKACEAKLKTEPFDMNLIYQKEGLQSSQSSLKESIEQNEKNFLHYKDIEKIELKLAQDWFKAIISVFEKSEKGVQNGYDFIIQYKSPCPKFFDACPLPRKDAKALLLIKDIPESCSRYATFMAGGE